nr:copper chaperone PCu(A)C [Rhodococcus sp. HNM0569]
MSACSAGQISQTATQAAAINGNSAEAGALALRNVHVVYPADEEYSIEPGGTAQLAFSIVNTSAEQADRLTSISTDYASSVVLGERAGALEIPSQSTLASYPAESGVASEDVLIDDTTGSETDEGADLPADVTEVRLVGLQEGVRPGLTFPVTFSFENAGDVTVEVPVDAGHSLERQVSEKSGAEASGGH